MSVVIAERFEAVFRSIRQIGSERWDQFDTSDTFEVHFFLFGPLTCRT